MEIVFEGVDQLKESIRILSKNVAAQNVEPELLKAVDIVADDMRSRAPVGPTGNLRKSVVAKLLPSRGYQMRGAFAGIERRKGGYHAHLVEYGTQGPRKPKKSRVLVSKYGEFFGTVVRPMPAHPFLRPAADTKLPKALAELEKKLKSLVEK